MKQSVILRRVARWDYRAGEWRVWGGVGRDSNAPTWHVERNGSWLISFPSLKLAREWVNRITNDRS